MKGKRIPERSRIESMPLGAGVVLILVNALLHRFAEEMYRMGMALYADHFTIEDLDRFDGEPDRHELIDGALLVTRFPSSGHQSLSCVLADKIFNFAERLAFGAVFAPGWVIVDEHTVLRPDLLVVPGYPLARDMRWEEYEAPLLTVEIVASSSRSFDRLQRREGYLRRGAQEYWIVDPAARAVTIVRPNEPDQIVSDVLNWHPAGASSGLELHLEALLG